ncbi:MAG: hypothetical protein E6I44_14430 [Chloroflexi bacterium]|nr:MAG: hypothetical protein E6I44_14430 [Chloroflexota bacterium]
MNSTETTPAPAVGGRQVGQLLAGRYRLAMFKGGDEISDVWHALDESTEKVVTLEILRDRTNDAARQRFLAEAQRMAAIERPSVMRVAAIHNEATDTFIVFEHLIPLPVVLTGLTGIAKDSKPATKAAEDRTALLTPLAPQPPASAVPSPLASVAGPLRSGATLDGSEVDAVAPSIVDLDEPPMTASATPAPETLQIVSSSLSSARSELSGFAQGVIADVREIAGLDELVLAARARIPRSLDASPLTSLAATITARVSALIASVTALTSRVAAPVRSFARVAVQAAAPLRSLRSVASQARPSSARAPRPVKNETTRGGPTLPNITAMVGAVWPAAMSVPLRVGSAPLRLIGRIRVPPAVLAGAIGILALIAFVASPLDDALVSALRSATLASPAATATAGLSPAPFEVPPLGAYGAAFESEGAYPTTTPSGTVEWVVALRNTGSAGWYRGIDGAQAALALPDGTGVAVQSTPYVAPGQVGWFVVHFRARAEPGTYNVQLLPRIDGRGPLADLGIYAVVTVSKNP